jgi:hypothetical protein
MRVSNFGGAMSLFQNGQLTVRILAHFLFEPVSDLGRMELPIPTDLSSGDAPPLDELFDLAPISSQLTSQFIEAEPILRHVSAGFL